MFDNILHQSAAVQLAADFKAGALPKALLFYGPETSGKLTTALELARVLNCAKGGAWGCSCPSCLRHRVLAAPEVLITGPRDCTLEIAAMRSVLGAVKTPAARLLLVRSVRKLTARFNPVLIAGDEKASKAVPVLTDLNERLEDLEHTSLEAAGLEKSVEGVLGAAAKLENYLYDTLPVDQVRAASAWARYTQAAGCKVVVVEAAERMGEGVRNALLKILEEPPEQALFILTTTTRQGIMPTILSRCRTYRFEARSSAGEQEILERIFHTSAPSIAQWFRSFLPVDSETAKRAGSDFVTACLNYRNGPLPVPGMVKFEPKLLLRIFFEGLYEALDPGKNIAAGAAHFEHAARYIVKIKECYNRITVYNQTAGAAFENLAWELCHGE
jgi:DNA polymerase-3 subunit gamma/tau